MDENDRKSFSRISKCIANEKELNEKNIEDAEPVDRYAFLVRKKLERFKTSLSDQT